MYQDFKKNLNLTATVVGFAILTFWWAILNLGGAQSQSPHYIFGVVYGPLMSIYGGIIGLAASRLWGGWKSTMGRAIFFLTLGLFAESFGQLVNSFYNLVLHVEVLYPSLGDVGFFGNIPLYLCGILLLASASGVRFSLKSIASQIQAILFPSIMLIMSYVLFLRNYEFDFSQPLTTLLDLGYPLGQALYVSIAFLTFSLSRNFLGGIMRNRILLLLMAFIAQYFADFTFLLANSQGQYYVGGVVDYFYLVAYTLMTLGFIQLRNTALSLKKADLVS